MFIVAFDTSGANSSVAIMLDNEVVSHMSVKNSLSHSQALLPLVRNAMEELDLDLADLDYIACAVGPGSFTGLRIGIATAKGLALSLNKLIIPVPTLFALAYNVFDTSSIICPILDARRGNVYFGFYQWENGVLIELSAPNLESIENVFEKALEFDKNIIFVGDGVSLYSELIEKNNKFFVAPNNLCLHNASSVALLGKQLFQADAELPCVSISPLYLKKPQAEIDLENSKANGLGGKNND